MGIRDRRRCGVCSRTARASRTVVGQRVVLYSANVLPCHPPLANRVANESLTRTKLRPSRLHLDEYDTAQIAFLEPVEYHEVDWSSEEARILGVEVKIGQIGNELFEDLPVRHRTMLIDRVPPSVAECAGCQHGDDE